MSLEKEESVVKVGGSEFALRVLFRQNSSIQGELHWLDTGQKMFFRSLLELIMLIQEALEEADTPKHEGRLRSWKDKDAS